MTFEKGQHSSSPFLCISMQILHVLSLFAVPHLRRASMSSKCHSDTYHVLRIRCLDHKVDTATTIGHGALFCDAVLAYVLPSSFWVR